MKRLPVRLGAATAALFAVLSSTPARAQASAPAPVPASSPATASPPASALPGAASAPSTALQQQLDRLHALQQQRPTDGLLVYYEALLRAREGHAAEAAEALQRLVGRGSGIVPVRDLGFAAVWSDERVQRVVQQLEREAPATPAAPVVLRLRDARLVPEGIAYDARRRTHYLGSIARRQVLAVDAKGRVRTLSNEADGLDGVLGLSVDAPRDRLCAVSTNAATSPPEVPKRNAVVCWDLRSRRTVLRVEVPEARQLNDLAIAADGTVYVTDSAASGVWRIATGEPQARPLGEIGALRGANGIALSPDGTLYVALNTGVVRVDRGSGAFERLAQPEALVTGGIDGLTWHDGDLFGVQNVPNPGRIVRLHLADGGARITALTVLQDHRHPAFATPTTGVVVGQRLHVIANSHVTHAGPDGRLKDPHLLRPTAIVAVPLKPAVPG